MKWFDIRKTWRTALVAGATNLGAAAQANAQQSSYGMGSGMMGGNGYGWMGGYDGMWLPILLVIVIIGLVAWIITQKRK